MRPVIPANGPYPIYGTGGVMGYASQYRCPANSIIIGRKGSINNPLFVEEPFCNVDTAFGMVPNPHFLTPKYFFYFCRNYDFTQHDVAVTIPSLRRIDLVKIQVPVPPLEEQSRIVAELDLLTGIIDKQNAQLKELDNLAQVIFYDMFGDLDDNRKGFDVRTLNEVFSLITDGTHQTPVYTDDKERGYKFLSAKDVTTGKIEWSSVKYIPSSLHKELSRRLAPQRGDILLCKNGTTGICALVETDEVFDIYVSLALLRTENSYNKTFLVYAINNPSTKRQFDDSLKGVGVPNLHLGEIKKTKIIIPPLALQQSFAEKIQSIEKQKENIRASIADTQKLLEYTMDKYFG